MKNRIGFFVLVNTIIHALPYVLASGLGVLPLSSAIAAVATAAISLDSSGTQAIPPAVAGNTSLSVSTSQALSSRPSAREILMQARLNPLQQDAHLKAQLRTTQATLPFDILLHQGIIAYQFNHPEETLELRLTPEHSQLFHTLNHRTSLLTPSQYQTTLRGTLLTYEDLALCFLYWPTPRLMGEDWVRARKAWKLEIQALGHSLQYGAVWVWVDQESGALLRIEGYSSTGHLLKRFEMISAQKLQGQWMLKSMRVESFDPLTSQKRDRLYLDVLGSY